MASNKFQAAHHRAHRPTLGSTPGANQPQL